MKVDPEDKMTPVATGQDPDRGADEGSMTDEEIASALTLVIQEGIGYVDGTLSPQRAKAQKYYNGEPLGNEEEGRSQVVLTDVRDSILQTMPDLMRIFFGPERPVEFAPRLGPNATPQDIQARVAQAQQMTAYVGDVVIREDNPGFMIFHDWFQDSLLKKIGVVKVWTEDFPETTVYTAKSMNEAGLKELADDPEVELIEVTDSPVGPGLSDVRFARTCLYPRVRFGALPPEEYIVTQDARSQNEAVMVAHRTNKTWSQLIALGIPEDVLEDHLVNDTTVKTNQENIERQPNAAVLTRQPLDRSTVDIQLVEAYAKLDVDRNGRAKLYRVRFVGENLEFVDKEPVARLPFATLTPYPVAHTLLGGLSRADLTMDLQMIDSSVFRGLLDSLSLSLFPATEIVKGEVEIDDVLSTEIGKIVRVNRPGMMREIAHEFLGAAALPVLDKLEAVREKRTGRPQDVTGLNADAMQSSTEAAVKATINGAQAHTELIARIFAETGVRDLMRLLLLEVAENQDQTRMVRLNGTYVPVTPKTWDLNVDLKINVGLGNGLVEQKIGTLTLALAQQKEILQLAGMGNPSVGVNEIWNTIADILRLRNVPEVERYFRKPPPGWQPPPPPPGAGQQPDPAAMIMAQAEMLKAKTESMTDQHKQQLAGQQQAFDQQMQNVRLEMERIQAASEMAMKERELELKFAAEQSEQRMRALLEEYRAALSAHVTARGQDKTAEVAKLGHAVKAATSQQE